jgi:hypothetical protein
MKILIFALLFLNTLTAQNLSINQIIELNDMAVTNSDNYLSKLGWEFVDSHDDGSGYKYISFEYFEQAILSKTYGKFSFIGISFFSKSKKNSYILELTNKGYVKEKSYMESGAIVEEFTNGRIVFSIKTEPNDYYFLSCKRLIG